MLQSMKWLGAAALVAVLAMGGPGAAEEANWADVKAMAATVKTITIYHNLPTPGDQGLLDALAAKFPNQNFEATRLTSTAMVQRLNAEFPAGVATADVVLTLWDDQLADWVDRGWVLKWTPPEAASMPAAYRFKDSIFAIQLYRELLLYNANRVAEADAPKDWMDLLDPKFKGRLGMNAPWRSVSIQGDIAFWQKNFDVPNLAERLKANGVTFFNGSAGVVQAIIRGDADVAVVAEPAIIGALADGAPIKPIYPASGLPFVTENVFVPKGAPNPEAGMVVANWLMSEEGQAALQEHLGSPGTRDGLAAPKLVPPNSGLSLEAMTDLLDPEIQKKIVDEFRTVFDVK